MKISYNIPRCGNLNAQLFPNAKRLFELFDHYGHIDRLKSINQLGRLRDIYQGAHHTRYEYVFLQLAIITELCRNNRADFGFSSTRRFCGKINNQIGFPTLGDLLQCLVILSNVGYMYGTLSASRAWLSLLKNDENIRTVFKRNLASADREFLKEVIEKFDCYAFKYLISLYSLQRSKRFENGGGIQIVEFGSIVIRKYLEDTNDLQIETWQNLYRTIRKISFITLDSLYAPVPFNLELSSIMLNFEELYETLFIRNATYNMALNSLEQALQNSVYLSSDACLVTSKATGEIYNELLDRLSVETPSASILNNLICTDLNMQSSVAWTRERKLVLTYRFNRKRDIPPSAVLNPAIWESQIENRLNSTQCIVGLLRNGSGNTIKLAFGLLTKSLIENQKVTQKIVREAIRFRSQFDSKYNSTNDRSNKHELVKFILKSLFGWDTRSILKGGISGSDETIVAHGRKSFINEVDQYSTKESQYLDAAQLHEIASVKRFIKDRAWSGLTLGYLGNIRLFREGSNNEIAEFDGLVCLPTVNPNEPFCYLIEAKNVANGRGHTVAMGQLNTRLGANLKDHLAFSTHPISNLGGYASIQLS